MFREAPRDAANRGYRGAHAPPRTPVAAARPARRPRDRRHERGGDSESRRSGLRLNELQVIGTHNSYHRETSEREQDAYDALISTPGDYDAFLKYSHGALSQQLERQDVRGLELDLLPDPRGGLYAAPLVRRRLGLGPLPDPAWARRGRRCRTSRTSTTTRRACSS